MTIFWIAIAVALIMATISWLLGRRPLKPLKARSDPYEWGLLLSNLVITGAGVGLAVTAWFDLNHALELLRNAGPDAAAQVDEAKDASTSLVVFGLLTSFQGSALIASATKTFNALKSGAAIEAATSQQEAAR